MWTIGLCRLVSLIQYNMLIYTAVVESLLLLHLGLRSNYEERFGLQSSYT